MPNQSISSPLSLSTKMNPRLLDFDSTSSLPPLQGLSRNQAPEEQRYMSSGGTQTEKHSDWRLHFTPTGEATIGSLAMAEYGEACRTKKRKGREVEKRNTCERKRRSRIADRMKTLQELLPNSSYKLSAASVLDKAIEYIKTLQLQMAVLGYQQMMMDGLVIPTHNFPIRESAWDNTSDSILLTNCGSIIPGIERDSTINPSTHPGLSYNSDGLFSSVTRSMLDYEFLLRLLQTPPMPIPGSLSDGFGGLLASVAASSPSSQLVESVSSALDIMF